MLDQTIMLQDGKEYYVIGDDMFYAKLPDGKPDTSRIITTADVEKQLKQKSAHTTKK